MSSSLPTAPREVTSALTPAAQAAVDVAGSGSLHRLLSFGGWSSPTSASRYLDDRDAEQRAAATGVEV